MDFDEWMLTKDPKYHPTDDTVALRRMRECWNDAQRYGGIAMMRDVFPQAHRLAMELECFLLSCTDTCATAKWWESANEALDQWRKFCREDDTTHNAVVQASGAQTINQGTAACSASPATES